jgi:glycosyltransferase involved in cell wall biosynthesis
VLHAHDYGPIDFMRRYFDEYRGLSAIGHSFPPFRPLATARTVAHAVRGDRRWLAQRGVGAVGQARWIPRSLLHHSSRDVFAALGASSDRLPAWARQRLSLEGRETVARSPTGSEPAIRGVRVPALGVPHNYRAVAQLWSEGPAPLRTPVEGMASRERLRIALVVPTFTRGSGGHNVLFQILARLERRGHVCSVWVVDLDGRHELLSGAVLRHDAQEFAPLRSPVHKGFDHWSGADVVVATGWQTVHPALLLPNCRARAYLVNDHEPEFFPASAEQLIAEDTYRHGLHCICGSPWLRDLLTQRYGVTAESFDYGVDHQVYRPREVERRRDTVIYYARDVTPRRAVPIGLLALEELRRRRPDVRIVLYGQARPVGATFPYEHAGLLDEEQLATLYSEATVGLCLSLTNFSLAPPEMMACGLPVVELAGASAESIFGAGGPIELAAAAPTEIAGRIERLLDDRGLWEQRSEAGIEFAADRSWDRAAEQVERGLRNALRQREEAFSGSALGPG